MKDELYVLWTNDNIITTEKMVFMYTSNGLRKGWWDEVTLIVWGATTELTANNVEIQKQIKDMISSGVRVIACKACAEQLGAAEKLESLGIEVFYTGEFLTSLLKEKKNLLTI